MCRSSRVAGYAVMRSARTTNHRLRMLWCRLYARYELQKTQVTVLSSQAKRSLCDLYAGTTTVMVGSPLLS